MGTKNNPGRFDCLGAAEPDEPMFILLARDPSAPTLIREWVKLRIASGESGDKLMEALDCAQKMDDYRMARDAWPKPLVIEADD